MASTINTSVITGGTNSHASTAAEVNGVATDFVSQGVNGSITNTAGVAPATGSFAVNAQGTPAMFVDVSAGTAYITATPSGQTSQNLRIYMSAAYTSYAISSNSSGSTKYDWIYLKVDPTNANNPNSAADNVTSLYTSRSSSNSTDNGSPPTYGILLAVVTVANGASSITNSNIADSRTQSYVSSSGDNGVSLTTIRSETTFDFVASGCVWSGDSYGSTRNGSMTAGVVYINGKRVAVSAISAHTFTASKDTYVDVDNTGTVYYSESTNNAASQALSGGRVRLAIIVTGASSIAGSGSVNQGQETMVLPIASSRAYSVTDSLGNLICPRDPNRKILGLTQTTSSLSTASTTVQAASALVCPVIVPTGRKVRVSVKLTGMSNNNSAGYCEGSLWDGVAGSGTQLDIIDQGQTVANGESSGCGSVIITPSTTSKTYSFGYRAISAGTASFAAASTRPIQLVVELV